MQKATHSEAAEALRDRATAIGLMAVALVFFSALDASAKYLVTRAGLPVAEVVWARFIGQFVLILVFVPALGVMSARALFTTSRPALQLLRSVLMASTTAFNFLALEYLRLDQTVTIVFLTPLVVALLAGPLLGEWVGWRRFAAIMVGFAGVLIVVRPGVAAVHPAVVYSLLAMLMYALFTLLTRYMVSFNPPLVTLFYSMFAGALLGAPLALTDWTAPPDALSWLLLAALGLFGGTGHYLFIHAYRLAPASVVAPFLYLQLLSMVAFGFAVFGDVPNSWTLVGSAVIVASGVYLFHRERRTLQRMTAAALARIVAALSPATARLRRRKICVHTGKIPLSPRPAIGLYMGRLALNNAKRRSMKSLLISLSLAALLPQIAWAETFELPDDEPVVSVTLPDEWNPKEEDGWVEATSADEEVFLAFELTTTTDFDASVEETVKYLTDEGVKLDRSTMTKTPFTINGMQGVEVAWRGTDNDGPVSVSLSVVTVTADKVLLLTYWATPKGDKDDAAELREILQSLAKVSD